MQARLALARRIALYRGPACPHCSEPVDLAALEAGTTRCSRCRRAFDAERFAPVERPLVAAPVGGAGPAGATACGAHPQNAALANCDRCGVFICGLCRVDSDEMALCPSCFNRLARAEELPSLKLRFVDYGARASSAAALGFLFCFPFGAVMGPLAVYYGVRGLTQPTESLGGKAGVVLAMLLGLLEAGMTFFAFGSMMWLH